MDNSEKTPEDLTKINWLQELAKNYLKEQKRRKFWRAIFKSILFVLIIGFIFIGPKHPSESKKEEDHVAVIDIEGTIFSKSKADAEHFIKALKKVGKNKKAVALILDINSPGGSPVQADLMYRALMDFRKTYPNKKVYAVCSDICASAAYYIASGAEKIYANPSSVVGSIGVLFNGFGFTDAMDKVGISRRLMTAGKNKGFLDPFSPVNEGDKKKLQVILDIVHQQFKQAVLKGRGNRLKVTDETFSGLFWTGLQAKEMGLIDDFGSIYDTFKTIPRVSYSGHEGLMDRIQKQLGESVANVFLNRLGIGNAPLA